MTSKEFNMLSSFIESNYGIKLPLSKKTMLEGRLQKRLRALNIHSMKQYCSYVFSREGQQNELMHLVDVVTTNKTDFFREAVHFEFLSNQILPDYIKSNNRGKPFNIWSAGCSTGEEPYTLAMVMSEFGAKYAAFDFRILGTDISSRALSHATTAVYSKEKAAPVPLALKKKYMLKSKDAHQKTVRIVPELRSKVVFRRFNFMESDIDYSNSFHAVFCRNVLIYFERSIQEKVIRKLCSVLEPGGFLFLGHSESILNMDLPLKQIQPATFEKI